MTLISSRLVVGPRDDIAMVLRKESSGAKDLVLRLQPAHAIIGTGTAGDINYEDARRTDIEVLQYQIHAAPPVITASPCTYVSSTM